MKENNYKGFTLIELLAVIVILAIIALIATPIVLDIIDDSKKSSIVRSADFYLDGVEFSIANSVLDGITITDGKYYVIEEGNICLEEYDTSTKTCKDSNDDEKIEILEVEVNGEVPEVGSMVEIKSGNIGKIVLSYDGQTVRKNPDGSIALRNVCMAVSGDGTKVGDEIECAGEYFHVISNDGSKINMLAKYNLDVGNYYPEYETIGVIENPTGIQSKKALGAVYDVEYNIDSLNTYGTINFSSLNYWHESENNVLKESYGTKYSAWVYTDKEGNVDEANTLYSYIQNYERYLNVFGVVNAEVTLISREQLISLGCDSSTRACSNEIAGNAKGGTAPEWVYSTSYWSGSAALFNGIWCVTSLGNYSVYDYSFDGGFGVRPVVTISSSDI